MGNCVGLMLTILGEHAAVRFVEHAAHAQSQMGVFWSVFSLNRIIFELKKNYCTV